jgi:hypothetical protein
MLIYSEDNKQQHQAQLPLLQQDHKFWFTAARATTTPAAVQVVKLDDICQLLAQESHLVQVQVPEELQGKQQQIDSGACMEIGSNMGQSWDKHS